MNVEVCNGACSDPGSIPGVSTIAHGAKRLAHSVFTLCAMPYALCIYQVESCQKP